MSEDALEVAVLESWLVQSDLSWLEEVVCSSIPEGGAGRDAANQMLRLHALYQAIRAEFPNMKVSDAVLDAIMGPDRRWAGSVLFGPLTDAAELGRSGWYGDPENVMGATACGREGSLEAVLVAGVSTQGSNRTVTVGLVSRWHAATLAIWQLSNFFVFVLKLGTRLNSLKAHWPVRFHTQ